jgi:dTDP-glucose 4,6-dehydratase
MSSKRVLLSEFAPNTGFFNQIVGREELELITAPEIQDFFLGKKILVIGAGGTIGGAVSRRLLNSGLSNLLFLDRDESALHALALSLSDKAASHSEACIVADIKDLDGLINIFDQHKPDVVIHAAALKHLVIVERFPREGYLTNVIGTLNVLEASRICKVSQVVNVSTDKAANPTSILGKTKRITELLVEEFNSESNVVCSSVRFGNVFASRGSVIETFVHQITHDLPVTLTDLKVTRFFMSHNEAANLILASAVNKDRGVFVQNMGEEILVTEIVKRLAKHLNKTFTTRIIGLQPGEKLNEELYAGAFLPTHRREIVKVEVKFKSGLLNLVRAKGKPKDNKDAQRFIEEILN